MDVFSSLQQVFQNRICNLFAVTQTICGAVKISSPFISFNHDQVASLLVFESSASLQRQLDDAVWPDDSAHWADQTVVEYRSEGPILATGCSAGVAIIEFKRLMGEWSAVAQAVSRMDG